MRKFLRRRYYCQHECVSGILHYDRLSWLCDSPLRDFYSGNNFQISMFRRLFLIYAVSGTGIAIYYDGDARITGVEGRGRNEEVAE